jgi:hypothetical protein
MRRRWLRGLSVGGCLTALLCGASGVPVAQAGPAAGPTAADAPRHVLVVLRNQHAEAPAAARTVGRRAQLTAADQAPLIAHARGAGGKGFRQLHVANAFAATLPTTEVARLAANPAVAAVVPDQVITAPSRHTDRPVRGATPGPVSGTTCPASPDHPLLEPEALQLTHTAFADPSTPSAQRLATGRGVTVAFLADGLDINNPDFIRPDGSHVFVDYKDFSGDGPDAPSTAAEAFGDASSIAAQGRQTYDLSKFVNPAHPLPAGCTIRVLGMAPDVNLVGIRVFGPVRSTFTSTVLAGLDWAVTHDHADVINESFGSNQFPDTGDDAMAVFNEQLVRAGVTMVAASGDAGGSNSIISPASSPGVIAVGATTMLRSYAQTTGAGFQLSNRRYRSNGISGLSSSGFTQSGRTIDLVAPGDAGWTLCTPNPDQYFICTDNKGDPASLLQFAGTSESAPLTAGAAALVIQAYRDSHGGASPTPDLVRRLLTSTADDLGVPANEQGAGLLDTLRAVRAAQSAPGPRGTEPTAGADDLLVGPQQIDLTTTGAATLGTETVTNLSDQPRIVHAAMRSTDAPLGTATQQVQLNATGPSTYVDAFGITRAFAKTTFAVPAGISRITGSIAWAGPGIRVSLLLLDPDGTYSANSRTTGPGNFSTVDVAAPKAGQWTAIVVTVAGSAGFTGPVRLTTTNFGEAGGGTAAPADFVLAPHQSRTVTAIPRLTGPGDRAYALVITSRPQADPNAAVTTSVVPVVLRTLVDLGSTGKATVNGTFTGSQGRGGAPNPVQTYDFDVPAGARDLSVGMTVTGDPNQALYGFLVDPSGEPLSVRTNQRVDSAGGTRLVNGLQLTAAAPRAGRWKFVFTVFGPIAGTATSTPFTVTFALNSIQAGATGLPTSAGTVLPAGRPVTANVSFTNTGLTDANYFVDGRLAARGTLPLVIRNADRTLPDDHGGPWPTMQVPTQSDNLTVSAAADGTMNFDVVATPADHVTDLGIDGDPDRQAGPAGRAPSVTINAPTVAALPWVALPDQVGPFDDSGFPTVHATFSGSVHTRLFDPAVRASTGDPLPAAVDAGAPAATPVTVAAGAHGTITVTITPTGARGTVVSGVLYLDDRDAVTGSTEEVAALPYSYTVG